MEDEYAKKLLRVARTSPLGKEETGYDISYCVQ